MMCVKILFNFRTAVIANLNKYSLNSELIIKKAKGNINKRRQSLFHISLDEWENEVLHLSNETT
jgi:hypothetical protein